MLIDNRIVSDKIWNKILFNSIRLIIHIIMIGVFLGDRFIINILWFLIFIIIIVIHSVIVIGRLNVINLVNDIMFGIKFIMFIVINMVDRGKNISINGLLFLFSI